MINKIERALTIIAKDLNDNNITWALGGSLLLHYSNITTKVHDIDILVALNDHEKLVSVLHKFPYIYIESNENYATEHFYHLKIGEIGIDIMLDFKVKTNKGVYSFPFNKELITSSFVKSGETIYLSSIDEWNKAYQAMNRTNKVELLKKEGYDNDYN